MMMFFYGDDNLYTIHMILLIEVNAFPIILIILNQPHSCNCNDSTHELKTFSGLAIAFPSPQYRNG